MEQFLHEGNVDYRSLPMRCSNKHLHAALQAKAVPELPLSAQGASGSGGVHSFGEKQDFWKPCLYRIPKSLELA